MNREVTPAQIKEQGRCHKLKPGEADFKSAGIPVKRKYRANGGYEWTASARTKRQKAALVDLMRPFSVADTERYSAVQETMPKVAMVDKDGGTRYLDPALADATARRNGWGHRWRAGGARVERGLEGGMLYRWVDGWEPLGVTCLGTPLSGSKRVKRDALHLDPAGAQWVWKDGEWALL